MFIFAHCNIFEGIINVEGCIQILEKHVSSFHLRSCSSRYHNAKTYSTLPDTSDFVEQESEYWAEASTVRFISIIKLWLYSCSNIVPTVAIITKQDDICGVKSWFILTV